MKYLLFSLFSLAFTITCGKSAQAPKPSCDRYQTFGLSHALADHDSPTYEGAEYYMSITVEGVNMSAIADTGSANLIISKTNNGSGQIFNPNSPSEGTWSIIYGSDANRTEVDLETHTATVGLECGPSIPEFKYGLITQFKNNVNNTESSLMGLAYRSIEAEHGPKEVTFFEQLSQKNLLYDGFTMLFCGAGNPNSRIFFGDTGNTPMNKFQYVPIVAKKYYDINAYNIYYGTDTSSTATPIGNLNNPNYTIIDSGTTLNMIPEGAYKALVSKMSEAGIDVGGHGANIPCPDSTKLSQLKPVSIVLTPTDSTTPVVLTIQPSTYFKKVAGNSEQCWFGFFPQASTSNMPYILGQVTMENYSVFFDRQNNQIGFAPNTECKP